MSLEDQLASRVTNPMFGGNKPQPPQPKVSYKITTSIRSQAKDLERMKAEVVKLHQEHQRQPSVREHVDRSLLHLRSVDVEADVDRIAQVRRERHKKEGGVDFYAYVMGILGSQV